MASLRKRLNRDGSLRSPYWFIRWKDPVSGVRREEATTYHIGRDEDYRLALKLKAQKSLLEAGGAQANPTTRYATWVPPFLQHHYANPRTLQRMAIIWTTLEEYLHGLQVYGPEQLRREHCHGYVAWREARGHQLSKEKKKPIHRNTIVLELKLLGLIQQEAVERKWIESNVAYRLGIERGRTAHRAELTPHAAAIIRAAIAAKLQATAQPHPNNPHQASERRNALFLHASFEIAMHQGIRLAETYFHLRDHVDWQAGYITFRAKGKDDYEAPMNPALRPLLEQWRDEGREWTYEPPHLPSLVWFKFMDKLRAKHPELRKVSFHGTRVHVISQLHETGAPEKVAMEMVNHASTTIHRKYRRVRHREIAQYWQGLSPKAQ